MKIIASPFKDYYDSVQSLGYDDTVCYVRRPARYEPCRNEPDWLLNGEHAPLASVPAEVREFHAFAVEHRPSSASYSYLPRRPVRVPQALIEWGLTLVAGTLYPFARITQENKPPKIAYTMEEVEAVAPADDGLLSTKAQKLARRKAFFALAQSSAMSAWATEHKVVAMRYTFSFGIEVNPRLADQELFRVLPPYQASQEIEMFLSNLASPEKDAAPVPDKYKVQAHGFDKQSFRTRPK